MQSPLHDPPRGKARNRIHFYRPIIVGHVPTIKEAEAFQRSAALIDQLLDSEARVSHAYPVLSSAEMQRKHTAFIVARQCPLGGKRRVNHNRLKAAVVASTVLGPHTQF